MVERSTAVLMTIKDLKGGNYVVQEGWNPNYIETPWGQQVSRVHMMGSVVDKQNNSIMLDDGSGTLLVRTFEPLEGITNAQVGDIVRVVGKPREYQEELFVVPELVMPSDAAWLQVHGKLLSYFLSHRQEKEIEHIPEETNNDAEYIDIIESLDSGSGASVEDIKEKLSVEHPDKVIEHLLLEGEIFEIRPGYVKVLR